MLLSILHSIVTVGNTASIVIACIIASVLSLVCGLAISVCSTWCCMRRQQHDHEESQAVRPVIYEEVCDRASRTENIELASNKAYGPLQRNTWL